jgi:hypothetical protein
VPDYSYQNPCCGWFASQKAGSGTITIASLSATRAAGTFSFTAVPDAFNPKTGMKVVAERTFAVAF